MPERDLDERAHLKLEDIKDYAVFRVDPEGNIASWNAGAEHMKLYTEQEAIGQPFAILFTPEDIQSNKPKREMEIAAETGIYEGEETRVRKGGEFFDAHVILRPLSDRHGVHRGFIKVTRDITEIKRAEAARAQRLITNLLDFTQVRVGGGFVLDRKPLELHGFVELSVEEVRMSHPGHEIHIEHAGDGQDEWDSDRLAQLITNLVNNALNHGQEDAPVRVSVRGEADDVVLAFHNQGNPIPPEALPRLFAPMQRGTEARRTAQSGSIGLGLFIVNQIVLAHEGTISVDSTQEQGTTFEVRLPRHGPRPGGKNGP